MEQTKSNVEKQMAEALLWVVKEYGDDFTSEDPEGCALIMESFIAGQDSYESHISELEKTVGIQDAAIEIISDSVTELEVQNKKLKEALEKIIKSESEERETTNVIMQSTFPGFKHSIPSWLKIAEQALKEDKDHGANPV